MKDKLLIGFIIVLLLPFVVKLFMDLKVVFSMFLKNLLFNKTPEQE